MLMLTAIRYVYNCGQPEVQGSCEDRETEEYVAPGLNFIKLNEPSNGLTLWINSQFLDLH